MLRRQAPQKEGLLTPRQVVRERDLLDHGAMAAALEKARTVNDHAKAAGQCSARETRLNAELQSLRPWEACDLPLNEAGTRCVAVLLGTVPSAVDFDAMAGAVSEAAEASQVTLLSADGQQQCLEVLVHRSQEGAALEALRSYGFSLPQFKDASGTARDNVRRLEGELEAVRARRQAELDAIRAHGTGDRGAESCAWIRSSRFWPRRRPRSVFLPAAAFSAWTAGWMNPMFPSWSRPWRPLTVPGS